MGANIIRRLALGCVRAIVAKTQCINDNVCKLVRIWSVRSLKVAAPLDSHDSVAWCST